MNKKLLLCVLGLLIVIVFVSIVGIVEVHPQELKKPYTCGVVNGKATPETIEAEMRRNIEQNIRFRVRARKEWNNDYYVHSNISTEQANAYMGKLNYCYEKMRGVLSPQKRLEILERTDIYYKELAIANGLKPLIEDEDE